MFSRRPGSGRKRSTTERDDRFMTLEVLRDRHTTAVQVQNRLRHFHQLDVSVSTIRRRLQEANLKSRRPATGQLLTRQHRIARLDFAHQHINWTEEQWGNILFTDESRFSLRGADGRERVWRRPGERYYPCTFSERIPFGGGSIMVWAGITSHARTELVPILNGALSAHRYVEEVLMEHVVPFGYGVGENFILMQDNARPHVAQCVSQFLDTVGTEVMVWPSCSPDLNPIEHLWDILGKRTKARNVLPETLQELQRALLHEWGEIDQQVIRNLIQSMPRRMQAVIDARGGNTRY